MSYKKGADMNDRIERLSFTEKAVSTLFYILIAGLLSWLFYDSAIPMMISVPFYIPYVRWIKRMKIRKCKEELTEQFIRALGSVSTSLLAGLAPQNAFITAASDMEKLYGRSSLIVRTLGMINSRAASGQRLTDALGECAAMWGIQEITDFAVVFSEAEKNGSNLSEVISSCTRIMERKTAAQAEAKVIIRGRQYEQRVMCLIPPGILAYLRISSKGFIGILYHDTFGIAVMTGCLAVYAAALIWSERIGDIRV